MVLVYKSRDELLTEAGKEMLLDSYCLDGEDCQGCFARVADYYGDNAEHSQRLYDYMSQLWFMPSTPILANGGTNRGLPISCYLNEMQDSFQGIADAFHENMFLSGNGGGIATYLGNIRSIGTKVGKRGKSAGIIPWLKLMEIQSLATNQGEVRKGSAAAYLPIWHPEIEEFIALREHVGEPNLKAPRLHHGVCIDDDFMLAVKTGSLYALIDPHTYEAVDEVDARSLWKKLLLTRHKSGEPYITFLDNANKDTSYSSVKMSNLCNEIYLQTGIDKYGKERTAVCCLSSLNLAKWDKYSNQLPQVVEDIVRMLDNVIEDFIKKAPSQMENAAYSAFMERSIGLGVMGFHSYLQGKGWSFEGEETKHFNKGCFQAIKTFADEASSKLMFEKGFNGDNNQLKRNAKLMAIAPTASISIICGETSPSIEPWTSNYFLRENKFGSKVVRNQHLDLTEAEWSEVAKQNGSIENINLNDTKHYTVKGGNIFKTCFEIDQMKIIELAADRQKYIDQGQSINLWFRPDADVNYINKVHLAAWELGLKGLYYLHSHTEKRANYNIECVGCQ